MERFSLTKRETPIEMVSDALSEKAYCSTARWNMEECAEAAIRAMREWLDGQETDTDEDTKAIEHVIRLIDAALTPKPSTLS